MKALSRVRGDPPFAAISRLLSSPRPFQTPSSTNEVTHALRPGRVKTRPALCLARRRRKGCPGDPGLTTAPGTLHRGPKWSHDEIVPKAVGKHLNDRRD